MGNKKGSKWSKGHKYIEKECEICNAITKNKRFCSNECKSIGMKGVDCSGNYHLGFKGKHHSEETRKLMSIKSIECEKNGAHRWKKGNIPWNKDKNLSEETKEKLRLFMKNNPKNNVNFKLAKKGYITKIERIMKSILDNDFINYIQQFNINKYFVDFYLPKYNLVIECDGEYWHRNKELEDLERDNIIKNHGFQIIHIKEVEFENLDHVREVVQTGIKTIEKSA